MSRSDVENDDIAYAKLASATDTMTRARLREEIRGKVKRIEFRFRQAHTACTIEFVNGAVRRCLWMGRRLYLVTGDGRSGDSRFWSKRQPV